MTPMFHYFQSLKSAFQIYKILIFCQISNTCFHIEFKISKIDHVFRHSCMQIVIIKVSEKDHGDWNFKLLD